MTSSAEAVVAAIIDTVLEHEGGFVDHPNDPGGATNYGISLRYARGIGLDKDGDGDTDKDDIRLVTRDEAKRLYRKDFFERPGLVLLPPALWPVLTDWAINSGPPLAIQALQRVLNEARQAGVPGYGPVTIDGVVGPQTRRAAEAVDNAMGPFLVNALVEERLAFYRRLVAANPGQRVFLKGWLARANSFRVEV